MYTMKDNSLFGGKGYLSPSAEVVVLLPQMILSGSNGTTQDVNRVSAYDDEDLG